MLVPAPQVAAIARICEPSGGEGRRLSLKQPPFEYLKLPRAEAADFVRDLVPLVGLTDFLDLAEGRTEVENAGFERLGYPRFPSNFHLSKGVIPPKIP